MSSFVCEVCLEERHERLELPCLRTGNGDQLRSGDCGHAICVDCMAGYVTSRVEEQRVFNLRCPHQGCKNELYEQDICRLVDAGSVAAAVRDRFVELRARDFSARARSFEEVIPRKDEDYEFVQKLWDTTRLCPRCSLVIEKASGCNSFYCICGAHFNYQTAPRAVGNGMKGYGRVISLARRAGMPLREAEKYNGDAKTYANVRRVAQQLRLSQEEARELLSRAQAGDEDARARIREARKPRVLEEKGRAGDELAAAAIRKSPLAPHVEGVVRCGDGTACPQMPSSLAPGPLGELEGSAVSPPVTGEVDRTAEVGGVEGSAMSPPVTGDVDRTTEVGGVACACSRRRKPDQCSGEVPPSTAAEGCVSM